MVEPKRLAVALETGRALGASARSDGLTSADMAAAERAAEVCEGLLSGLLRTAYEKGRSTFDIARVAVKNGELSVALMRRAEVEPTTAAGGQEPGDLRGGVPSVKGQPQMVLGNS